MKEGREASEEDVRRVVTEVEVQRWRWLRQKRAWERGAMTFRRGMGFSDSCANRSHYYSLSNAILPSCGSEANKRRGGIWMGKTEDMSRMCILILCILQTHMVSGSEGLDQMVQEQ